VTVTVDIAQPRRVLAIGAHPDDVEFGCGATLAKWSAGGAEVHLCICTDGSKGTWDDAADLPALVAAREQEQRDAAGKLGAGEVHFLGYVDGELDSGLRARAALAHVIRRVRPEVVLGHDPWRAYRLHPDHFEAGLLTIGAIVGARDPHFFPEQLSSTEGLRPHRPATLLLFEARRANHVERVDSSLDDKIAALLAHRSQWRSTMGIDPPSADQVEAFARSVRDSAEAAGIRAGVRAGEAFARLDRL
jgi:LmbE family N-acetylglucosaminyl deacetylase